LHRHQHASLESTPRRKDFDARRAQHDDKEKNRAVWRTSTHVLPEPQELREDARSFSSLAGHSNPTAITMTDRAEPHRIFAEVVTANYFDTLGLRPYMGRFFLPSEDSTPGAVAVAVLGYTAWQARFGGAPDILGRTIKLNNTPFTIVGIGP